MPPHSPQAWPLTCESAIQKAAKKNGVKIVRADTRAAPKDLLEAIANVSEEAELACLETRLRDLETHLEELTARALAWADGDVAALRNHSFPDPEADCGLESEALQTLRERGATQWLDEVERALADNDSTFSMLPMRELLSDGGLLSRLREKGFLVEDP